MSITKEQLTAMIADPEQLKILAASMAKPRRCGGLDYIDGKPFYRVGSRHVPQRYIVKARKPQQRT